MTPLDAVLAAANRVGIKCALIGASALTLYGVARSTVDVDLLTVDDRSLQPEPWAGLADAGVSVDARRGSADDPLAGVVRFAKTGERGVDLLVGRFGWQRRAVDRAVGGFVEGRAVPAVQARDLILLKLYAGGPQDAWDVQSLLAGPDRDQLIEAVQADIADLPADARRLWAGLLAG